MDNFMRYRGAIAAVAALSLAACSDTSTAPISRLSAPDASNAVIVPVLSDVVVGGGTFTNPIVGTEAGRAVAGTPFFGNPSSDDGNPWPNNNKCNVSYFALGTNGPTCFFTQAGSSPGGFAGGAYYGSGAGNTGSPAFMFKGSYSFNVVLKGAYSFGSSTVGYYTKTAAGVYTLTPVGAWSTKQIGFAVTINTGDLDWGFYVQNPNFTGNRTCGTGANTVANTACSDATGGFSAQQFQQFALMTNAGGSSFLVGLEDNILGLWAGDSPANPTNQDSDYNDYIFTVAPSVIPPTKVCDFITFGRLVLETAGGDKVVISGNAGGNAPGGGILGEIQISVGGVNYHVHNIDTYGLPTSGVLFGDQYARVITGASGANFIEIRLRDDPNPGKGEPGTQEGDKVYLKINGVVIVGLQTLDKGNIQLHLNCRGPKD